eukprot:2135217-Pleurochrysis_carterae.AAC.1
MIAMLNYVEKDHLELPKVGLRLHEAGDKARTLQASIRAKVLFERKITRGQSMDAHVASCEILCSTSFP